MFIFIFITSCSPVIPQKLNKEGSLILDEMPIIESYSFGSIVINGKSYGDIKIHDNKIMSWQYTKHHTVTSGDVEDIIGGIDFLVIGIGSSGEVQVEEEVLNLLREKGVGVIVDKTKEAVDEYNRLIKENKKVAAILHSTC